MISATLVLWVVSARQDISFGRFGYAEEWSLPAMSVSRKGFRIKHELADQVLFSGAAPAWKAVSTSSQGQLVELNGKDGAPKKLSVSAWAPGFAASFPGKAEFKLTTTRAPLLTWQEGSVGENVPTPPVAWVIVSFRDSQPPFVLGFPEDRREVIVKGAPGAWTVECSASKKPWVRVVPGNGNRPFRTNSAAELGTMLKAVRPVAELAGAPVPKLLNTTTTAISTGLVLTWQFDRAGALLPSPLFMAPIGGYPLSIGSPVRQTEAWTEHGPLHFAGSSKLVVTFPVRQLPPGRALAPAMPESEPPATVSWADSDGVRSLAHACMWSWRDAETATAAEETVEAFIAESTMYEGPHAGTRLPFEGDPQSIDLAASVAMLSEVLRHAEAEVDTRNALLYSVLLAQDQYTWEIWNRSGTPGKATLDAAFACSLSSNPILRRHSALLGAAYAARRGVVRWAQRRNLPDPKPGVFSDREVTYVVAFGPESKLRNQALTPIRLLGNASLRLESNGREIAVVGRSSTGEPVVFEILSSYPIRFVPGTHVARVIATQTFNRYRVKIFPTGGGTFDIKLLLPKHARGIFASDP